MIPTPGFFGFIVIRSRPCFYALLILFFFLGQSFTLAAENIPEAIQRTIAEFGPIGNKAAIVRTKEGLWLVAAATAGAGATCLGSMEHDCAVRAAVVEAKRCMSEKLSADIETVIKANMQPQGGTVVTRTVKVAVTGQVLSRVQLLEESYDAQSKRCRVVIASAPEGNAIGEAVTFPNAETAARHLLERASHRLCSPGVICARLEGSTSEKPQLAFVAIAIGPRMASGQHEVSNAKAQAILMKFWREQVESKSTLEQRQIPDPDDPSGSRLLNLEHFNTWAKNHEANRLPGFHSEHLDRDDFSYTAIWCTN